MALVYLYLRFFLKELVFSEGGEQKGGCSCEFRGSI